MGDSERIRRIKSSGGRASSSSSSHDRLDTLTAAFPDEDPTARRGGASGGSGWTNSGLLALFEDSALTDTTIVTSSDTSIAAHKVVLAAHSGYFRAIFAGASSDFCVENSRSVVRVENIDDDVLLLLLRLMYGGDRLDAFPQESTQRLIGRLMDAAAYLSVHCVVSACSTFLLDNLRVSNAVDLYLLSGERVEYAEVHARAIEFIVDNFGAILRCWEGVEGLWQLSKDDVVHILCGRHRDCVHKGVDVVMTLLLWTRGDDTRRSTSGVENSGCLDEIVGRLGREMYRDEYVMAVDAIRDMEKEAGASLLMSDEAMNRVGVALFGPDTPRFSFEEGAGGLGGGIVDSNAGESVTNAVFSRDVFHQHQHRNQQHRQQHEHHRLHSHHHDHQNAGNTIIAVGGIHSGWKALRSTELYNIDTDSWSPGLDMPMDCSFSHACTSSTGDTFIPVTKSSAMLHYTSNHLDGASVRAFDTATTAATAATSASPPDRWRTVEVHGSRVVPRASSAAVAFGEDIHVLGGRPTVGRDCHPVALHQCLRGGRWLTLAPMSTPRASMDACVTLDRIWCVGGQSLRQTHDSMEWYDPAHDCWFTSSSKMSTPRKYATINTFRDPLPCSSQIIIMGGMNDVRTRLASVEAYDPREGRLRQLASLPRPVSSSASCVSGYNVYLIGGRVDRHGAETDAVWRYDARGGSWTACAPMLQARSSLTAFVR